MTRTEGTLPMPGHVTDEEPELVDRPVVAAIPEISGVLSAQDVVATRQSWQALHRSSKADSARSGSQRNRG